MPEPDRIATAGPAGVSWGLADAAVGWLVGLVGGTFALVAALAASGTRSDDLDALPLSWMAVAQLGLWFGLLGAPYLAARYKGNGMRRDFGLAARWSDPIVGGVAGVVGQFVILWLVYVPMHLLTDVSREQFSEPARELTNKAAGPVGAVLLVLLVGLGAPVVEEIFYRGLLQRSLIRRIGAPWGIVVASVLFGASHLQLVQFPALALAGVLFGVLAYRFGRLGPAIAAHVVFNMTAVVVLLAST